MLEVVFSPHIYPIHNLCAVLFPLDHYSHSLEQLNQMKLMNISKSGADPGF